MAILEQSLAVPYKDTFTYDPAIPHKNLNKNFYANFINNLQKLGITQIPLQLVND